MQEQFTCQECGATFSIRAETIARYPGWKPKTCLRCRNKTSKTSPSPTKNTPSFKNVVEDVLTLDEVLTRYHGGPQDGVFTDGACRGNPGPGGWGVVHVKQGMIVTELHGADPQTTNNRMELTALIHAYELLPDDTTETIWSDSQLCINTITQWATKWRENGWKKKGGPIKNLELVKRVFELAERHPRVTLRWIKAHDGSRWNEYADALATAFMRTKL